MSTFQTLIDHYKNDDTSKYYHCRPQYSQEIYNSIKEFMIQRGCQFDLAVDIACGNGISSRPLADFFKQVKGLDASETQIAYAAKDVPNLSFGVADAHNLSSLEAGSVDLLTIATAIHRLDKKKFFQEVDRVLKPGGVIAVYTIGERMFIDIKEIEEEHRKYSDEVFFSYKGVYDYAEQLAESNIQVELPYKDNVRKDVLSDHTFQSLDDYIGLFLSCSTNMQYEKDHPERKALANLQKKVEEIMKQEKTRNPKYDMKLHTRWPTQLWMGQKPKQ